MSLYPQEILTVTIEKGIGKANGRFGYLSILGFLGGAFIALGYLSYIKVVGGMPHEWGSFATLLGASVFPIGLIGILIGGGELITGNMMVVSVAYFAKRVSITRLARNWIIISSTNLLGALAVAWFFGHYLGITEGILLPETLAVAQSKVDMDFSRAVVSGIGCNWMVCMGVWLAYGAKSMSGKILGIWFPVMIFVLLGFQHVVANMFVIPAAMFAGANISMSQFFYNLCSVYLGNTLGGAVLVGGMYFMAYRQALTH